MTKITRNLKFLWLSISRFSVLKWVVCLFNTTVYEIFGNFLEMFLRSKIFVVILSLSRKHLTIKEVVKWLFWVPWCSENHKESLLISYLSKFWPNFWFFRFWEFSNLTLSFPWITWQPYPSHTVYRYFNK